MKQLLSSNSGLLMGLFRADETQKNMVDVMEVLLENPMPWASLFIMIRACVRPNYKIWHKSIRRSNYHINLFYCIYLCLKTVLLRFLPLIPRRGSIRFMKIKYESVRGTKNERLRFTTLWISSPWVNLSLLFFFRRRFRVLFLSFLTISFFRSLIGENPLTPTKIGTQHCNNFRCTKKNKNPHKNESLIK